MDTLYQKKQALEDILRKMGKVFCAFSAGVDSSLLLKVAHDTLGDNAAAVTADSCFIPRREIEEAREFCASQGIRHIVISPDPLSQKAVADNPGNRCYFCKKLIFSEIVRLAADEGAYAAEGSNTDDMGDYRPGMRAVRELNVRSPLLEAGLSKAEIRTLSKELGLSAWDKPSYACLATRIPYGEVITPQKLSMAEMGEEMLHDLGFRQVRVRVHGDIARIETPPHDISVLADEDMAGRISGYFKKLGFSYVTLDLEGYRHPKLKKEAD